jgi:hypothetical protein
MCGVRILKELYSLVHKKCISYAPTLLPLAE